MKIEPPRLDARAKARRKTAMLWFVAVTFGTMALLSLPIGRLITGFGKPVHRGLGSVEQLIRPITGWQPPPVGSAPPVAAPPAGPVLLPDLTGSIEAAVSATGQPPVEPSKVPAVKGPNLPGRQDQATQAPARLSPTGHGRGRHGHHPSHPPHPHHP